MDKTYSIEDIIYRNSHRPAIKPHFRYDHALLMAVDLKDLRAWSIRFAEKWIRQAETGDIPRMAELVSWTDGYRRRFDEGHTCFVAEYGGRIIALEWMKKARTHFEEENEYAVDLEEDGCWTYDTFIDPAFRLTGLWPAMKMHLLKYAASIGLQRAWCMVIQFNEDIVAAQLKIGHRIRSEIVFVKFLALRVHAVRHFHPGGIPGTWRLSCRTTREAGASRMRKRGWKR